MQVTYLLVTCWSFACKQIIWVDPIITVNTNVWRLRIGAVSCFVGLAHVQSRLGIWIIGILWLRGSRSFRTLIIRCWFICICGIVRLSRHRNIWASELKANEINNRNPLRADVTWLSWPNWHACGKVKTILTCFIRRRVREYLRKRAVFFFATSAKMRKGFRACGWAAMYGAGLPSTMWRAKYKIHRNTVNYCLARHCKVV